MASPSSSSGHASHAGHSHLKNPDGSWKFTNALARESSPYLLQHAHNPVDWHPWGPAAFDLARKTGKPIFLSVGYSTCYWCHVMERQVFENVEIAQLMNEHFINIKVDREERPDVDDIYMIAVQVMTGHGGWPMSVFLTPPGAQTADKNAGANSAGLKPFYAGTYFPPEPSRGMPGFPQVVLGMSEAWTKRRDEVLEQADQVAHSVSEHLSRVDPDGELSVDLVQRAANALLRTYDAEHGGFGSAPKFPTPSNLFFLLQVHRNNPSDALWQAIAHTLDRMARGGMYDQIGGGFHRYSTDEKWLVPHFEKMLYDNGQLAEVYAIAHATRPPSEEPQAYADVLRGISEYVMREMTDATGAFWSAQDAEVDAMEGGNYVWTAEQVREALADPRDAELAIALYGLDQGPNFRDPHHADAAPVNVLHQPARMHAFAKSQGMTLDQLREFQRRINRALLAVRDRRKQPGTDDKVLTAWNGMMIAGMARAGSTLSEPRFVSAAARAAKAVMTHLQAPDGGLLRTMRRGATKIPAFLDDYAYFIHGLIELHRAQGDESWLSEAKRLANLVRERFGAESATKTDDQPANTGGYFDTLANQADLFVRTRSTYDGAIPSGNSQMVHNLADLYELTRDDAWLDRAAVDLRSFARAMQRTGHGMAHMHGALLRVLELAPGNPTAPGGSTTRKATSSGAASPSGQNVAPVRAFESTPRQVVSLTLDRQQIDLSAGEQTVTLTLSIGPDYHLNAHKPGVEGVIGTELFLVDGDGIDLRVDYPAGQSRRYEFATQPLSVYEKSATIKATLRRRSNTNRTTSSRQPRLVLRYQVCTEMSCLAPREEELPVEIR